MTVTPAHPGTGFANPVGNVKYEYMNCNEMARRAEKAAARAQDPREGSPRNGTIRNERAHNEVRRKIGGAGRAVARGLICGFLGDPARIAGSQVAAPGLGAVAMGAEGLRPHRGTDAAMTRPAGRAQA